MATTSATSALVGARPCPPSAQPATASPPSALYTSKKPAVGPGAPCASAEAALGVPSVPTATTATSYVCPSSRPARRTEVSLGGTSAEQTKRPSAVTAGPPAPSGRPQLS